MKCGVRLATWRASALGSAACLCRLKSDLVVLGRSTSFLWCWTELILCRRLVLEVAGPLWRSRFAMALGGFAAAGAVDVVNDGVWPKGLKELGR